MRKQPPAVVADEAFDPLAHINPRSPSFYEDAAAAAAYLIHGEGHWQASARCALTAAIMHQAIQGAREDRRCSLSEVNSVLAEASRKIRTYTRNHSRQETEHENDASVS